MQDEKRLAVSGNKVLAAVKQHVNNMEAVAKVGMERAVISAVLHDPKQYVILAQHIEPEDMHYRAHALIWRAFQKLSEANTTIDALTVGDVLKGQEESKPEEGWTKYVEGFFGKVPEWDNLEHYALQVREASVKARMCAAADEIMQIVIAPDKNLDEIIGESDVALFKASDRKPRHTTSWAEHLQSFEEDQLEKSKLEESPGIKTGLVNLDVHVHGLHKGEVCVLLGGSGVGKSTFLATLIYNIMTRWQKKDDPRHIVLFTMEMDHRDYTRKLVSIHSGVGVRYLKDPTIMDDIQRQRVKQSTPTIKDWNFHIVDHYKELTPAQLRNNVRRLQMDVPLGLVLIDGLFLMEPGERVPSWSNYKYITRKVVDMARLDELGLTVIMTHQFNGEIDKRRRQIPNQADAVGGKSVAYPLQHMWALKPRKTGDDVTELHILKNRNTPITSSVVKLGFDDRREVYEDAVGV